MSARIAPAMPPFPDSVQKRLDRIMDGRPPLTLFTTIARDARLSERFFASSLLDPGNLSVRHREIVINRVTARCNSEYEWGVHVALFKESAGLTEEQITSTVRGYANDECWAPEEKALILACDNLHDNCDIDDQAWEQLVSYFSEEAIIEILMLAGTYRTIAYLTNAMRLPLEEFGTNFPQ